jgi:hypothetical protein
MQSDRQLANDATLRVLASLYPNGDHRLTSFLYGEPGSPPWQRLTGATVYVRQRQYITALLFIRKNGAPFLRDLPISAVWHLVTAFIVEHYAWIVGGNLLLTADESLGQKLSPQGLAALSEAMLRSPLFHPSNEVTLYPMTVVQVIDRFQSANFALCTSTDLTSSLRIFGFHPSSLVSTQFPPFDDLMPKPVPTSTWLCVNAPDLLIARKRASAVLGALALSVIRRERYLQTGREVQAGHCTISSTAFSFSLGAQPITPNMPSDIIVAVVDHCWLNILSGLLDATGSREKSRVRALEYFYRAWFDDPRERFPALCMALDSLVSVQSGHTKAAIAFVTSTVDEPIDGERLRALMRLRGAIVHGAAPDVYESEHYETYYATYGEDPICDLELLVARCMRRSIFGDAFIVHPDPHAALVKQQQDLGRMRRNLRGNAIINDN